MNYKNINLFEWSDELLIGDIYSEIKKVSSLDIKFPLAVRLMENPKFKILDRNLGIFPGAVDGTKHDYIHIMLGRSFLPLDEVFVVGFCMGSTKKMSKTKTWLFNLLAGSIYPKFYRFSKREKELFQRAVDIGAKHSKTDLSKVPKLDFSKMSVRQARSHFISEWSDVVKRYKVEAKDFPDHTSSKRLEKYLVSTQTID